MKKHSVFAAIFLMICLVFANVVCTPDLVSAKELTKISQAKKLAKKQVKGATVVKAEKDDDDGITVFEVKLSKGKKQYQLVYRASDSKLLSYEWEIKSRYIKQGSGKSISVSKCKSLAQKQVPGASITSISKKSDDGISIYKVKMKKSGKKFELKFNARTGKLIEYEWELTAKNKNSQNTDYIGEEKASQIALTEAGGGTVTKIKFDMDDGVPVYEIDIINGDFEYEIKIHATTGKVLEIEKEPVSGTVLPPQEDTAIQITLEAAKEIAVSDAGVSPLEVVFTKTKLDRDDGVLVYEIEFCSATHEYEYEINAFTGAIRSKKKEALTDAGGSSGSTGTTGTDIGIEAAKEAAITDAGVSADDVTYTKAKLDREDGILVYDIEFYTATHEYEYEINASTGAIYSKKKEVLTGGEGSFGNTGATGTDIGMEAAKQIALKEAGGVTIEKAELDWEDGVLVYEVKIINGGYEYEIKIDAGTGEILQVEADSIHS